MSGESVSSRVSGRAGSGGRPSRWSALAAAALLSCASTAVVAQTGEAPPAAAATELSALCTDRPTKSNFACVVDTGHWQYESDVVNHSRFRLDGAQTETWLATNPTLKYGIAKDFDIEASIAPWVVVRSEDGAGNTSVLRGPGDLYLRAKWNFFNSTDGKLSVTALPYVKAATARHGIGNGASEGGLILPTNYALTDKITLTTVPEFDALKDANGNGRHFNTAQLVNVGVALPHDLTLYGELWGDWNVDPVATVRQFSADAALAWGVSRTLQLDIGFNLGLNRNTPRRQAYFGVSQKF